MKSSGGVPSSQTGFILSAPINPEQASRNYVMTAIGHFQCDIRHCARASVGHPNQEGDAMLHRTAALMTEIV